MFCMKNDKENNLILGFDSYLINLKNNKPIYNALRPIKSIDNFDDKNIIVSTNAFVFKINKSTLNITDTLLNERGTKVVCVNGKVYVGTLKGIKLID